MKKQNDKMKKDDRDQDKTNRKLRILIAAALILVLLVGGPIWAILSLFDGGKLPTASKDADVETYLTEKWPVFQLRSWDPATGALELDYLLRFTYAQMEKYGGTLDELKDLPTGNLSTVAALKTAALEDVGASIRDVTVRGLTTDGQTAYTVYPDGSVTACWDIQ